MKYVFAIYCDSGLETTASFFADSEESAREKAIDWAGANRTVGECVERWSVEA